MKEKLNSTSIHDAIMKRHSIRVLSNDPPIDADDIQSALELAQHCPSAYNMQSQRLVCLMGDEHKALWAIVFDTLKARGIPNPERTEKKLQNFANGAGSILFFEEMDVVNDMQEKNGQYADQFDKWSEQNNAIMQYNLWLIFSAMGLGASLQHYNPIIDDAVKERWNLPKSYRLVAQMPFGRPAETPTPPPLKPLDEVLRWIQ